MAIFSPGLRVLIRNCEWRIKRVEKTSGGNQALHVIGISEIVRNKEAIFIDGAEIKDSIRILDPKKTRLVADTSSHFIKTRLYLESLLRQIAPTHNQISIGHQAAMDMMPFQLQPALMALEQPRQRILIADSVGLGKTLEAGILLSELIRRGRARRILVVAIKSMLTQFQKEMWCRFSIPLVRLDSIGLQRVRAKIPTHQNPFYYYDRSIISIDTLKQDNEFRNHLENARWDVIVIDEAHNVAERGNGRSQRSEIAHLLAGCSDSLILLSATPHDGRRESFASLMNMLDPTAIPDSKNYGPDDIKGLYVRRFKHHVADQLKKGMPERIIKQIDGPEVPSLSEENTWNLLSDLQFEEIDRQRSGHMLFRIGIEKALFSSPSACIETLGNRIRNIRNGSSAGSEGDCKQLENLKTAVEAIDNTSFSKYQNLINLIKSIKWKKSDTSDRLVIFTERIATLEFIKKNLPEDLGLSEDQIAILHGQMDDITQQKVVEEFGQQSGKVRLLIASDVASEGINLHYQSHRMIHFDIPWSLMVFQQRNGRIDRYGQCVAPEIYYMMTNSSNSKIKGDARVLELLIGKDDEVQKSIGDPASILKKYDVDSEEARVAEIMDEAEPEKALDQSSKSLDDLFADIFSDKDISKAVTDQVTVTREPLTMFSDELVFAKEALSQIKKGFEDRQMSLQYSVDEELREIILSLNEDLEARYNYLPDEIRPKDDQMILTALPSTMIKSMDEARKKEETWPQRQYLWQLHPVSTWICDRIQSLFGRHEAPFGMLSSIGKDEIVFLLSGQIPSRQGRSLVHEWFAVVYKNSEFSAIESLETFMNRAGFTKDKISNRTDEQISFPGANLLSDAVSEGEKYLREKLIQYKAEELPKVHSKLNELDSLLYKHQEQLEIEFKEFSGKAEVALSKKELKKLRLKEIFNEYKKWIDETKTPEECVHILVHAAFYGGNS
jgi:superfamily II DNA or RNA helicase